MYKVLNRRFVRFPSSGSRAPWGESC